MWNYAVISFVVFTISLLYHYCLRRPASIIDYPNSHYDYIVVGAGTAGCVMAARLSESPNVSVLLVEAGDQFGWLVSVPILAPLIQGTDFDWAYQTEPQQFSSKGFFNRKQKVPRGKGLGGTGQINYLIHTFGSPEDYKDWPQDWTYFDLLPYFRRVYDTMNVITIPEEEYLTNAFIQAEELFKSDNATLQKSLYTVKRGSRWSTFQAYLMEAWERKNLHILPNTLVSKIFFKDSKADGIKVLYKEGSIGRISVKKEIILCAGSINTPQLMLLSGVGPVDELNKFQIPVVHNLPAVGRNLFDHLVMPLYINLEARVSITLVKLQTLHEVLSYFLFGKGWYATNGIMGVGRINGTGVLLFGMASTEERIFRDIGNYQHETFRILYPAYNDTKREGFLYLVSCLHPKSRGSITLKSANVRDPPKINPEFLKEQEDVLCTQKAINFALDTLNAELFKQYGACVHVPNIEACKDFPQDYRDPGYSECIIRTAGLTSYHPCGSCKMGNDDEAVVDEKLRVRGIKGLRIMDASVFPSPISGTPNSIIVAMAEHAADIIINGNE